MSDTSMCINPCSAAPSLEISCSLSSLRDAASSKGFSLEPQKGRGFLCSLKAGETEGHFHGEKMGNMEQ